ncbi:hypothetical protein QYF36_014259 [Acer negundo]|nr:hypothetical protein QYF36_014259 [Acer negundo]
MLCLKTTMLHKPISMVLPRVVGFKLFGKLGNGVITIDLVLTVTQMLRKHSVVGKFVEFYGGGMGELSLADRATIANMSPLVLWRKQKQKVNLKVASFFHRSNSI